MAQLPIAEAASRRGVPLQTLEAWAEQGLLTIRALPRPEKAGPELAIKFVDEDELDQAIESLGWLHLSGQGWDGGRPISL
jgi:hypothetical protein